MKQVNEARAYRMERQIEKLIYARRPRKHVESRKATALVLLVNS